MMQSPSSSYQIKELNLHDYDRYLEHLLQNKSTWTQPISQRRHEVRSRHLLSSQQFVFFGAFAHEGSIVMSIGARRWEQLPVYSLIEFRTSSTLSISDFKKMFPHLIRSLVFKLEAEGRFEFWYLIEDKGTYSTRAQRRGRNIMQYLVGHLKDYHFFNEARIDAGVRPMWRVYSSLLSDTIPAVPTVIRRALHKKKLEDI